MIDSLDPKHLHWVDVDGIRTRYYEAGQGPTLVLLHGGEIGSLYSLDAWSLNLPTLARDFRVIAVDRLGQGWTDNPTSETYRPQMMLDHTRRFLEVLGVEGASVVGHSRGALIGTWLAQHHPALVGRLVMVDSRSTAPEDDRYPNDVFYERLGHRQRLLAGEVTLETVGAEPTAQSYDPRTVTPDFLDRMLTIARLPKSAESRSRVRVDREARWLPEIYAIRADVLERIESDGLGVPTLVVWGRDDESAPLPVGLTLFERIAARTVDAEMHILNRAKHYCFRDRPAAFDAALRSFCLR
jgi:2-hydroxy-6-oxo-6-(2'-carboxyphenyl)-hexa-2,4-dienoate hydrolase